MDNELDLQYDRLLGEGSYGKVFLVKQQDGQQYAVKEIDLTKCDESGREQAHGESNLLSRLKQDNILLYVESIICDECLYIITEYCEGGDLEDYLQIVSKKNEMIPEALVSDWILQLGGALKYLHEQKILHRDMKTKNIFLKDDLTVKLGDLGIAKVLDLNQSKADTFIGTPSYMSPELFSGQSYNHKTDIWGLGCCAYEMMTLKRAFQGKALWTLIREIKNGRVLDLPDTFSLDIRTLVQEMMSQKPEDRPSARDIVQNDLLCYHRGAASGLVQSLPRPHEYVQEKQKSKSTRNKTGSGSGSLRNVILQMSQSQDKKYKDSIASVCEKINTLRMTGKSDGGFDADDCNTFVYKGDSDDDTDDNDLKAEGTILDNSLLKQYTEQLETFMFKGEGILNNEDSDYSTIKSRDKINLNDSNDDDDDDDDCANSRTLLKQYSETLEDDDEDDLDGAVNEQYNGKNAENRAEMVAEETDDSGVIEDNFDETIVNVSKYQYKGLKDTFALRREKNWKRQASDPRDLFVPVNDTDRVDKGSKPVQRSGSDSGVKSPSKSKPLSLSASFSSDSSVGGSRRKMSDPRLNQSLRSDDGLQQKLKSKMKTCDRIEQSAKIKQSVDRKTRTGANKPHSPKKAFIEIDPKNSDDFIEEPDLHVQDVISHLRENITPYSSVDSHSEIVSPNETDEAHQRDNSPSKVKKKSSYLRKQSEAKRKAPDIPRQPAVLENGSNDTNVKLFTRGQTARFSKSENDEDNTEEYSERL